MQWSIFAINAYENSVLGLVILLPDKEIKDREPVILMQSQWCYKDVFKILHRTEHISHHLRLIFYKKTAANLLYI